MAKCILIDNDLLTFIKATPTVVQAEYWAELLIPLHDFRIQDTDVNRHWSVYTLYELRRIYHNVSGVMPPDTTDYGTLIKGVADLADNFDIDKTPVETLRERLGRDLKPVSLLPEKETRKAPPVVAVNLESRPTLPTRPKEGSSTGKVWEACDWLYKELDRIPTRAEVVGRCEGYGINASTAQTQYSKWKKALVGL